VTLKVNKSNQVVYGPTTYMKLFDFQRLIYIFSFFTQQLSIFFLFISKTTFGEGFNLIRGLVIIFFFDALLIDDEPLWEPIE
jgi:hypothetical protein